MPEAIAGAVKALAELALEIVKGQPPEVKKQLWEWYVADMKSWRDLWGIK